MKRIIFPFIVFTTILFFSACNNSDDFPQLSAIGTVKSLNTIYLDTDSVIIRTQEKLPAEFAVNDRAIVYFSRLNNNNDSIIDVNITNINKIPTSAVNSIANKDTVTFINPIIKISRIWIIDDFLTVDFTYYAYNKDLHQFELTKVLSENKSADTITLNLRHEANNDEKGSSNRNLLSFNLSALKPLTKDTVTLAVKSLIYQTDSTSTSTTQYLKYIP